MRQAVIYFLTRLNVHANVRKIRAEILCENPFAFESIDFYVSPAYPFVVQHFKGIIKYFYSITTVAVA